MNYLNQPLADSLNDPNREKPMPPDNTEQPLGSIGTGYAETTPSETPPSQENNQSTMGYIQDSFKSAKDSFNNTIEDISSKDLYTSGKEFIQSNTIITKLVFLVLVLIFFLIIMNLGIFLIVYFSQPEKNPYLIDGVINGNRQKTILQDPKNSNSITIYRSNNQREGIEFTWSVWLLRNTTESNFVYNNIFNKGSSNYNTSGIAELGNGPGVYFYNRNDDMNNIKIIMDTVAANSTSAINEEVVISNLPIGRWFHLAIRMENKIMDVYVNGVVSKRLAFENVPFQNYRNVLVCQNGGFDGNLSDLRYFDNAMSVFQIMNIVEAGPNLRSADDDNNTKYNYLANSWYMNN